MTRSTVSVLAKMFAAISALFSRVRHGRGGQVTSLHHAQLRRWLDDPGEAASPIDSLESMCDALVELDAALLACVYALDCDVVRRIACAGPAHTLLREVPRVMPLSDPDVSHSYTAGVLRSGVGAMSNDYVLDSRAGRWRAMAVASGVRSVLWIPIRGRETPAVLMLCAGQPDFYDEELRLLVQALCDRLGQAPVGGALPTG